MTVPIGMYTLSNAQVIEADEEAIIIVSDPSSWMPPVLGGIGLAILGFLMLITREIIFLLVGLLAFSAAFYMLTNLPYSSRAVINFVTREIAFTARYLLRAPRNIDFVAPLTELVHADFRGGPRPSSSIIDLIFRNGTRLVINFGSRSTDAAQSMQRLKKIDLPEALEADKINAAARAAYFGPQIEMQQRLRTWSVWMFIMAVVQLASGALNPWALLLIVIGGASFYFRVASMFIMYAVIIAWAGVSNLLFAESTMWRGFAFLQVFWAYQLVNEFRRYHRIERAARAHPEVEGHADLNVQTSRAGNWFPWIALVVGLLSLGLLALSVLVIYGSAFFGLLGSYSEQLGSFFGGAEVASLFLGLLGLAAGLAGWASGYHRKFASIIGTIASAVTVVAIVALILLGQ